MMPGSWMAATTDDVRRRPGIRDDRVPKRASRAWTESSARASGSGLQPPPRVSAHRHPPRAASRLCPARLHLQRSVGPDPPPPNPVGDALELALPNIEPCVGSAEASAQFVARPIGSASSPRLWCHHAMVSLVHSEPVDEKSVECRRGLRGGFLIPCACQ